MESGSSFTIDIHDWNPFKIAKGSFHPVHQFWCCYRSGTAYSARSASARRSRTSSISTSWQVGRVAGDRDLEGTIGSSGWGPGTIWPQNSEGHRCKTLYQVLRKQGLISSCCSRFESKFVGFTGRKHFSFRICENSNTWHDGSNSLLFLSADDSHRACLFHTDPDLN